MPPPAVLHARLLGTLDLRHGDQPLAPLESARAESLLAYLLLHRGAPQPRQHLAFLLWPDSTERQAQTNLRKVLHRLRHGLPDADRWIDAGPRTLRWRPEAPVWLDVEAFETALAEGRLEDAVELYAGDLLEDRYDEWLADERERLAELHLDALGRLARRHATDERWEDAIRCAERLVARDPLREDGHRLLIELYRASGDRARAMRAYHVCATTLAGQLGIEPSAATRAVYDALIAAPDSGEGTPGQAPFVGRTAERASIARAWSQAAGGRAQLVVVTGEAGIGKTRLVDELRSDTGALTVEARAYPAERPVAYGVAAAWLRAPAVAGRLSRLETPHRTELARLVPELAGTAPPPEPLPDAEMRRRLFGALARALLGAGAPLLVVLDDAHWADAQTLRFLHYLLRAAPSARLLVAATARREELDAGHPLVALTAALQAVDRAAEIALQRLDRDETALLAERIAGAPLDAAGIDRLYGDSEGNPLFVVEALQPDAPDPARRVKSVIAGRLARLSAPAAALAGVAAAIGRAFEADLLASAAGVEEPVFVAALDELWRRGIVRADGPAAYDFSHGRLREEAYATLSPPRLRQAHLAIARALEAGDAPRPAALALHYEAAGAISDAVAWYARAADAAQWLHDHAGAVAALERALRLSGELPPGRGTAALQLRLLTALPAPLIACEGYASPRMTQVHAQAVRLAQQLGAEPEPPLVWSLALAALTRGDWAPARDFADRLHAQAEREGDEDLQVESDYIRGIAAYWPGHLMAAREHFEAALRRFRPARRQAHVLRYGQDPELLVRMRLAHTLWLLGDDDGAVRERDLALAAAEVCPHAYSRATVDVWAGVLAVDRGDLDGLRRHAEALRLHAADDAPAQLSRVMGLFTAFLDVAEGRPAAGLRRLRGIRDDVVHGPAPAPGVPGIATRLLLEAYALAGDTGAGLALAEEALEMGRGAQVWEAEIRRLRATFLAARGASPGTVEAELRRALDAARRQRARALEDRVRGTLAERRRVDHGRIRTRSKEAAMTTTDGSLRARLRGDALLPGDPGYDDARQVFNAMIDRRPAAIARCTETADVVAALEVARQDGLPVAVRCGGHSVAGLSVCDGGLVIDLGGLKAIDVDPQARTARAGGGVLWGEFDAATQVHGLHTPGGRITTTGLGGFTTGGGYGWTSCKHGLACDNLISAEVVLADGRVVRASEHEHADLFWGIRGGGGNFGIVTEFEFRLHPLGPTVLAGMTLFEMQRGPEVMRAWRDWADAAPDELATGLVVLTAPPEPFVPAHLRGERVIAIPVLYVGDPAEGGALVQPLRDLAPALDHVAPMPYTAFQAMLDAGAPHGFRSYWRGEYMREFSDAAIDTFLEHAADLATRGAPLSQMIVFRIGQGVGAIPDDATAFSHRDAGYLFHPVTMWAVPEDDERLIAGNRAFAAAMRPYSTGASYLNFTPEADRIRDAYGAGKHRRLVALKDAYDPANVFRGNQNIAPSGVAAEPQPVAG